MINHGPSASIANRCGVIKDRSVKMRRGHCYSLRGWGFSHALERYASPNGWLAVGYRGLASPERHDPENETEDGQDDRYGHAPYDQVENVRPCGVVDDGEFVHLAFYLPFILFWADNFPPSLGTPTI